jgi:hypothetical protein
MASLHKLEIVIPTTGEACLFDCLDRIVKFTPKPYALRLWYNVLDEFDYEYLKKMLTYTKDVIVCHKGYGGTEESMFHQLTCEAEFLMGLCADSNVSEDYFEKLMAPLRNNERVGLVGHRCEEAENATVPDKISVVRKKAIDDVGAVSPLFHVYGHNGLEQIMRMRMKRWVVFAVPDVLLADFENKKGKKADTRVEKEMAKSDEACSRLFKNGYKDFNWWMNQY